MFNPPDFLTFANTVFKSPSLTKNEALYRSAISRSYYAAFLTTREKLERLDPNLITHFGVNSHDDVVRCLCDPRFLSQQPYLPDDLKELKNYRVEADYHFDNACHRSCKLKMISPDRPETVVDCLKLARDL